MAENQVNITAAEIKKKERLYAINTATIFSLLQEQWKRFDRPFLVKDVQNAFFQTLCDKKIYRSLDMPAEKRREAIDEAERRYQQDANRIASSEDSFPFVDFFLAQEGGERQIVDFDVRCEVGLKDQAFPLFFFLQFSLTDVLELTSFLEYQLHHYFEEDEAKLATFLKTGLKKYAPLLPSSHSEEIATYTVRRQEMEVQKVVGTTEYTRILAMYYIFQQLGLRSNLTNMSDAARLGQFITGIQTDAKQIGGTSVYKYLKDPLRSGDKTSKEVIKSLQLIRPFFEKLELTEIVAMITKDLESKS